MSAGWRARNSRTGFCRAELENSERDSALRFSERLGLVDEFGRCGGNWRGARRQSETVENLLCRVGWMYCGKDAVVLLPDVRQRTDLYQVVTTDLSGRFRLDPVPPGEYKIFAWASVDCDAWFDPDFMSNYEKRGRPLHISEGSRETVEVTVIPAP